jgi:hypothetical protein
MAEYDPIVQKKRVSWHNVISDNYSSRRTKIKIPEIKKSQKLVNPSKLQCKRSDLDGYGPTGKEVAKIGTDNQVFRDSSC